jgi:hypothetical protein
MIRRSQREACRCVLDYRISVPAVQLGGEAPACSRWRLTISRLRDPQAACAVQLAALDLYCRAHGKLSRF